VRPLKFRVFEAACAVNSEAEPHIYFATKNGVVKLEKISAAAAVQGKFACKVRPAESERRTNTVNQEDVVSIPSVNLCFMRYSDTQDLDRVVSHARLDFEVSENSGTRARINPDEVIPAPHPNNNVMDFALDAASDSCVCTSCYKATFLNDDVVVTVVTCNDQDLTLLPLLARCPLPAPKSRRRCSVPPRKRGPLTSILQGDNLLFCS